MDIMALNADVRVETMFGLSVIRFALNWVLHILFKLLLFIYDYWCPTLFPYQMMFVSLTVILKEKELLTPRSTCMHLRFCGVHVAQS